MFRVLFAIALLVFPPVIARAENNQLSEENQVVITVTIDKQSGEVKITIANDKRKNKEGQQKSENVLSDNSDGISDKRHAGRRGK